MLHLLVVQILPLLAAAHIEMSWPYPLRSRFDPRVSEAQKRYDMTSPLLPDGSDFPCKGYQKDLSDWGHAPALAAGSTYNMSLAGSANHGGGSCQISLSYDNGATFKVIKSIIGGCPLQATYSYTVPRSAPNGNALFAWTWQNLIGNREYYMNCAQVKTRGGDGQRADFDNLPFLWKANLVAVSNCTTSENVTPVYPRPGVDVEYGSGLDSSSPPSPGICDSADISPPIASSPVCSEHDSVA